MRALVNSEVSLRARCRATEIDCAAKNGESGESVALGRVPSGDGWMRCR